MINDSPSVIQKKFRIYVISMLIVVAIIIGWQLFSSYLISHNISIAKVINLAGRQRMLSQRLTKEVLNQDLSVDNYHFKNDLNNWQLMHKSLQFGNDSLNIPPLGFQDIQLLFDNITPYIEAILVGVKKYESNKITQEQLKNIIINNEQGFLSGMDAIVFELEKIVAAKIKAFNLFGILFSILIITILLSALLFVVKPFSSYINQLKESEKIITKQNIELTQNIENINQQNDELHKVKEELKASFEDQIKRSEQLEKLNKDQENLLHVVAHDLRAPFSKLYGLLSVLKDADLSETDRDDLFEHMENEYQQGTNLIEDMLESFSTGRGTESEKELSSISNILLNFANRNHIRLVEYGIELKLSILPDVEAKIYPTMFLQALENVLSNAIKFTPLSGEIHLVLLKEREYFVVVISDTGIGIPEDIQPYLFEKFNNKVRRLGLHGEKTIGLGMSIVKQVTDQHNGIVLVKSEEGKGTSVTLKIPFE